MNDVVPKKGGQHLSRHVQASNTLMRTAVHKPTAPVRHRVTMPIDMSKTLARAAVPAKLSVGEVDTLRLRHAKAIKKSTLVTRFTSSTGAFQPTTPMAPTQLSTVQPAAPTIPATSHSTDLFISAMNAATSHEQPHQKAASHKRRRRGGRIIAISAATLSVIAVGSLMVFQNMGNIRLQLASSKAGFSASIPTYNPSGFGLKDFSASTGIVQANFKSNSDSSRNFTITEKPSSWDSDTLRDSYVRQTTQNYQVVQSAGRTVYIYNTDTATWVNGGIWYIVNGNGSLSNNQLIRLATSL
jgi:hypothetical protein